MKKTYTIENDLDPTDVGYASAWVVSEYPDGQAELFKGAYGDCESYIGSLAAPRVT